MRDGGLLHSVARLRHCRNFQLRFVRHCRIGQFLHTVIETAAYLSAASDAGMTEEWRNAVVDLLAANPMAGDIMPGCGGARKLRVARPGKGKSGGYRVITWFGGDDVPVFLLTVFGKNERANLTKAERNGLAIMTKRLAGSL
jgi:hypothetical protein